MDPVVMREKELADRWGKWPSLGTRIDPEVRATFSAHPHQAWARREVSHLLLTLRTLETPLQYYNFQRWLWDDIIAVQRQLYEARGNLKRILNGRPAPSSPYRDWWTHSMALRQINIQLRSVGDALAWQLFDYDRRYVVALSRNDMPGPVVAKTGHSTEIARLMDVWKRDRVFALLNDLTNNIRIGDLTLFPDKAAPEVVEVKTRSRVRTEQKNRINSALAVLHSAGRLPDRSELIASTVPLRTHLAQLKTAFASIEGGRGTRPLALEPGWAVVAMMGGGPRAEVEAWRRDAHAEARRLAGISEGDRVLSFTSDDHLGIDPSIAPFTIFPLPAGLCSALTCGPCAFAGEVSITALADAFVRLGYKVEVPERLEPTASGDARRVMTISEGSGKGDAYFLVDRGLLQGMTELMVLDSYAAAIVEAVERKPAALTVGLTFADERSVWGGHADE